MLILLDDQAQDCPEVALTEGSTNNAVILNASEPVLESNGGVFLNGTLITLLFTDIPFYVAGNVTLVSPPRADLRPGPGDGPNWKPGEESQKHRRTVANSTAVFKSIPLDRTGWWTLNSRDNLPLTTFYLEVWEGQALNRTNSTITVFPDTENFLETLVGLIGVQGPVFAGEKGKVDLDPVNGNTIDAYNNFTSLDLSQAFPSWAVVVFNATGQNSNLTATSPCDPLPYQTSRGMAVREWDGQSYVGHQSVTFRKDASDGYANMTLVSAIHTTWGIQPWQQHALVVGGLLHCQIGDGYTPLGYCPPCEDRQLFNVV